MHDSNGIPETHDDVTDISYSILVDKRKPAKDRSFVKIQQRRKHKWVDDTSVNYCYDCRAKFTTILRKHHCIAKGTLVATIDNISAPIENILVGTHIPSWDKNKCDIVNGRVAAHLDQGHEPCMVLTLEDGRELIATSDHKILSIISGSKSAPKYVMMKELTTDHKVICLTDQPSMGGEKYCSLPVVSVTEHKNSEPIHVYDLSVPKYTSFVANGIVVHNCRLCASIFCASCSSHRCKIPERFGKLPEANTGIVSKCVNTLLHRSTKVRVCNACYDKVQQMNLMMKEHRIDVFDVLIIQHRLDLKDLKKCGTVCKLWQLLSNYYLSTFRELQYTLPNYKHTRVEKALLIGNVQYFVGHSKWIVQCFKSLSYNDYHDRQTAKKCLRILMDGQMRVPTVACKPTLMCTGDCSRKFDISDLLTLLSDKVQMSSIREIAIDQISKAPLAQIQHVLPHLVYQMRHCEHCQDFENKSIGKLLVTLATQNPQKSKQKVLFIFQCKLYWQLYIYTKSKQNGHIYQYFLDYFMDQLKRIDPASFEMLAKVQKLTKALNKLPKYYTESDVRDALRGHTKHLILPSSQLRLRKVSRSRILLSEIQILGSATRPVIIPVEYANEEESQIVNYLWKREDVRKDQLIMNVITLMKLLLRQKLKLDGNIQTYEIIPTGCDSGIIEMVDDCETLYKICQKSNFSILNFVIEKNPTTKVGVLRDRFVNSCASYCVITYLLGIGDRHLENIMVRNDGTLFHIDFSYILGFEPMTKPIGNSGMRISKDMVDALGGPKSKDYQKFLDLCHFIYNSLRRYTNLFAHLILILVNQDPPIQNSVQFTEEIIYREIIQRFIPGETVEDAKVSLYHQIENSSRSTYTHTVNVVNDWFHYQNREGTLRDFIGGAKGLAKGVINAFNGYFDQ